MLYSGFKTIYLSIKTIEIKLNILAVATTFIRGKVLFVLYILHYRIFSCHFTPDEGCSHSQNVEFLLKVIELILKVTEFMISLNCRPQSLGEMSGEVI